MNQNLRINSANFQGQPFWLSTLNNTWKATYPLGTRIRLDKDDLIRKAKNKSGLTDLGRDFSDEPLDRLIRSANEEANLNPVGRFITRQRFVSLLEMRLRAEYFFRKHPEILEQEIYPAWIIVGLQRTGTTKLQRLLATDPAHRWLPSWEVINPIPLSIIEDAPDKRIRVAKTAVRALKLLSPGFFAIHPIDIFQPEEDILLLDISFMSTTPEAMMHVPSYARWLERTDQSQAYAYMVKLLKFLQWRKPGKRWILKTPHHLEFPELITKHFGEVHFFWPHRSIYESVPSFLSMVTYNRMIFSNAVDRNEIAAHWIRKTGYMLQNALDFRMKNGNDKLFTDIDYTKMVEDPVRELSMIYSADGGISPEQKSLFKKHNTENPYRKYGTHNYSLEDFGLTTEDIDKYTLNYQNFVSRRSTKVV
jgi:hypothetical protein